MKTLWWTEQDGPTVAIVGERDYPQGTARRIQIVNAVEFSELAKAQQHGWLLAWIDRINYELDLIAVKAGAK